MPEENNNQVNITLTEGQAQAVARALDFYSRIGIGQIEEVADLLRREALPVFRPTASQGQRTAASMDTVEDVEEHLNRVKAALGYPRNGSHGIGHPDNDLTVTRSYEVQKVLRKALIEARDVPPTWRTVDHDGLVVRYTNDPAPTATVTAMNPQH